jgi:hypothetical protein
MKLSKHHLGIGFEVWNAQQAWFWFVRNTNRDSMIGAAASEASATRDARSSIEELFDTKCRPDRERSLGILAQYPASPCSATV